jgi:diadenylate cyclase
MNTMRQLSALLDHPAISVWDVVDILIVSILIYEALKLIRGTRAAQMAIGLLLVLAVFQGSRLLPLQTVNWLVRNLLVYVGFAAIVLFQADIRRALALLGRAPFFRYFENKARAQEIVEEIVTAAGLLAKNHVGAIIVVEREIGLRNYVESGIPIDAVLSYDLLTTIFQPTAPMHDGAVIVQEDRIAAAACFLPLSVRPGLDRDLGTRHRAAIGLSEESDALAVVVSEQRGEISVALGGHLERGLSTDDLHARLQQLIVHQRRADRTAPAFDV